MKFLVSIVLVLIVGLLALIPGATSTGYMDGANWTGINSILNDLGFGVIFANDASYNNDTWDATSALVTSQSGVWNASDSTKVNKTNAGELSGGTLAYSIFPINITAGGVPIHFYNGTNNISIGTNVTLDQFTSGIITSLSVRQTDGLACSGNITITNVDTGLYKTHVAWSSVANITSSGLSASFIQNEPLRYNMTENTGCKDLTFRQVHTKTS